MSIISIDQRSLHTGGATWTRKSGHAGASPEDCSSQCCSGCQGYLGVFSCPSSRQADQEMMYRHSAGSGTVAVTDHIWLQMSFPSVASSLLFCSKSRVCAKANKPDAVFNKSAHRAAHMEGYWQWTCGIGPGQVHISGLHLEPFGKPCAQP